MNLLLQPLASPAWSHLVQALLHTLWLGGLAAGGLYFVLRGRIDPGTRYRWCVGALLAVVLGGIVAWAVLQQRPAGGHPPAAPTPAAAAAPAVAAVAASAVNSTMLTPIRNPQSLPATASATAGAIRNSAWTPWLALLWLGGAAAMLARAGSLVAGAENLRRKSRPLENEAVLRLIEEARRKLRLARRIQAVVTEQLTSPAVMGVVTPVLILPLSLVTALPMEQLQLILLHELAHIRRGDYLVNLCQLLAESLLFFNPAVWWISRQIRQEREACCDAMAIELAGEPLQYARTLAQAAGEALAAVPAFGDRRNPSGLKDRIQRLLVPGYRPALRLTWRALLASLLAGGGLLLLSAVGTRVAIAAVLSPQERIDRIGKKMTELGENPDGSGPNSPSVQVSGRVRMADGSPVPDSVRLDFVTVGKNSSYAGSSRMARNGFFDYPMAPGDLFIGAELSGYALAVIGPLDGRATNRFENLELVFGPGFDATIQLADADSGKPVPGGTVSAVYYMRGVGGTTFRTHTLTTEENGSALLANAADQPLVVTANAPGYEILEKRFESVQPNKPLRIALRAAAKVSGVVLDKTSAKPIAGATVRVRYEKGPTERGYGWDDANRILATTDESGRFVANQLRTDTIYWLGVSAEGHESIVLNSVHAGNVLEARLGPEIIVNVRVTGDLDRLEAAWNRTGGKEIAYVVYDNPEEIRNSYTHRAIVRIEDGAGYFQFTNRSTGRVVIQPPGQKFERIVEGPVDDWVIELAKPQPAEVKVLPKREVVIRFKHPSGVPPRGTVSLTIQDNLEKKSNTAHSVQLEITNGEARAEIEIGGQASIAASRLVGYWFDRIVQRGSLLSIAVSNGPGPQVIEIPLVPAGAIYAKARNADGTPAGNLGFGVTELKRAPGVDKSSLLGGNSDGFSGDAPRQWVSGPLPLGGTYQVYGWRGNLFCVSKPVKLTEANPDAEIELQFTPGKTFDGVVLDPEGKPLREAELKTSCELTKISGFGLKSVFTDERGRFRIENATPELGTYSVEADVPGMMAERVKLDFGSQPQTIRLKRGRTLGGRVVEAATGQAIPNVWVSVADQDRFQLPMLRTETDANGRFEFTTLGAVNYTFYVTGAQLLTDKRCRADGSTNVVLPVRLYEWSQAKPKAP